MRAWVHQAGAALAGLAAAVCLLAGLTVRSRSLAALGACDAHPHGFLGLCGAMVVDSLLATWLAFVGSFLFGVSGAALLALSRSRAARREPEAPG